MLFHHHDGKDCHAIIASVTNPAARTVHLAVLLPHGHWGAKPFVTYGEKVDAWSYPKP